MRPGAHYAPGKRQLVCQDGERLAHEMPKDEFAQSAGILGAATARLLRMAMLTVGNVDSWQC
jgi:hypothetical protein